MRKLHTVPTAVSLLTISLIGAHLQAQPQFGEPTDPETERVDQVAPASDPRPAPIDVAQDADQSPLEKEEDIAVLRNRIKELEDELANARKLVRAREDEMFEVKRQTTADREEIRAEILEEIDAQASVDTAITQFSTRDDFRGVGSGWEIGNWRFGGLLRANYILGDYPGTDFTLVPGTPQNGPGPTRDGDGGTVEFDTLGLTVEYDDDEWFLGLEYRFYSGAPGGASFSANFPRQAFVGYRFLDGSELKAGLTSTMWGYGTFGASVNFLESFDTYVGLSNDRDLGITYSFGAGDFEIDLGYFPAAEPGWRGSNPDSARASYDIISTDSTALVFPGPTNLSPYEERHTFNTRITYFFDWEDTEQQFGISGMVGQMHSTQQGIDSEIRYAVGGHHRLVWGNWQFLTQASYYNYQNDNSNPSVGNTAFGPLGNSSQVVMGAFDFPLLVSSEGVTASFSASYTWFPESIDFIDYVVFYTDYSHLFKFGETTTGLDYYSLAFNNTETFNFRDSQQWITGFLISSGGWLIYTDFALGVGAPLIGNRNNQYTSGLTLNDAPFGANNIIQNFSSGWQLRFNINFGYYF